MHAPLRVLSSMATRAMLAELADAYMRHTPRAVALESVGGVDAARRVASGEVVDVVVLARDAIDALVVAGHVAAGSCVDLARSGVAVAVRAGSPRPAIHDEAALKAAVLGARTIGCSTGPSGAALARLFDRWGIAQQVAARIVTPPPGVAVGRWIAEGRIELGFQQRSELLGVEGVDVVGPLPEAVQITTVFSGAVAALAADAPGAHALLAFLAEPAADGIKQRHGMEAARP